jgi:prefoldin subunit 5
MSLLEVLKEEEQKLERQLATVKRTIRELGGTAMKVSKVSAATRAKMARAAKKRWAAMKAKG